MPLVHLRRQQQRDAAPLQAGRRAGRRADGPAARRSASSAPARRAASPGAGRGRAGRSTSSTVNGRTQESTPAGAAGLSCGRPGVERRLLRQRLGHLGDGRPRVVGRRRGGAQPQPARRLDHELADGDRVQVEVREQPAVVAHRLGRQLRALGHELAQEVAGSRRGRDGGGGGDLRLDHRSAAPSPPLPGREGGGPGERAGRRGAPAPSRTGWPGTSAAGRRRTAA